MKPLKTVRGVLQHARNLIANVGWTQGIGHEEDRKGNATCYCMYGAILDTPTVVKVNSIRAMALGLLQKSTGSWSITQWNDVKGRTKKQVLAAFDKAIKAAPRK